jgi:hypothetical protein
LLAGQIRSARFLLRYQVHGLYPWVFPFLKERKPLPKDDPTHGTRHTRAQGTSPHNEFWYALQGYNLRRETPGSFPRSDIAKMVAAVA